MMKEYKILTVNSLEQAEQVMNDMARAGWQTQRGQHGDQGE